MVATSRTWKERARGKSTGLFGSSNFQPPCGQPIKGFVVQNEHPGRQACFVMFSVPPVSRLWRHDEAFGSPGMGTG